MSRCSSGTARSRWARAKGKMCHKRFTEILSQETDTPLTDVGSTTSRPHRSSRSRLANWPDRCTCPSSERPFTTDTFRRMPAWRRRAGGTVRTATATRRIGSENRPTECRHHRRGHARQAGHTGERTPRSFSILCTPTASQICAPGASDTESSPATTAQSWTTAQSPASPTTTTTSRPQPPTSRRSSNGSNGGWPTARCAPTSQTSRRGTRS